MSYPNWTLSALLVLCGAWSGVNQADEPQLLPRAGVLVLRSGTVLRGDVLRVGDRYVVTLGPESEVGVPVEHVEMCCSSLPDAYAQKRTQLPASPQAGEHLALADWCLRYGLFAEAAEQLMAAQALAPGNPANDRFETRLRLAARRTAGEASAGKVPEPAPSRVEPPQSARSLPPGTVEQFTNTVQPLLINRCGAGACHGPTSDSSFSLTFPHRSRLLPRRFTERNLQATLALLNAEAPDRSPLLRMATAAHGGASQPPLTPQDASLARHLTQWAYQSTGHAYAQSTVTRDMPADAALSADDPTVLPEAGTPAASADSLVVASRSSAAQAAPTEPPPLEPDAGAPETPPARHESGRDPFDPEVFNRRYLQRGR